jgi:hypothetical protein
MMPKWRYELYAVSMYVTDIAEKKLYTVSFWCVKGLRGKAEKDDAQCISLMLNCYETKL